MAKSTLTKLIRKFDVDERGHLFKRQSQIAEQAREERLCAQCRKPMLVAPGQLAYFHKECRERGRNSVRRA